MKTIQSWLVGAVVIAACALTASKPAYGDTFQEFLLWSDQDYFFYSMNDSGDVALVRPNGFPNGAAYYTFHYGVPTALFTPVVPTFIDDQGTPCTPTAPPGGYDLGGACNNGRDVFTGALSGSQVFPGLYSGSFPDINTIVSSHFGGEGNFLYMNSNGDIVVDDVFSEDWYFFLDTTTSAPEPGSILLLGTGALAAIGASRRRSKAVVG